MCFVDWQIVVLICLGIVVLLFDLALMFGSSYFAFCCLVLVDLCFVGFGLVVFCL